ncbi:hypothetical protein MSAN_00332200 [Mycena sanguinolenta]|uniref:Uncharacterized protein n=1 Tax=Mycena sanguinolenta TaxID=230812 RepID=A0A8H6ZBZ7_9AGAR|nr:hypothetical protein MSAN_00332200 [Mycena sanguinolenta]
MQVGESSRIGIYGGTGGNGGGGGGQGGGGGPGLGPSFGGECWAVWLISGCGSQLPLVRFGDGSSNSDLTRPGKTALELQQAIFDRFEILEENGTAFLSAKSPTAALKNVATMTVEEQFSSFVDGHIADNLRNDASLFQINSDEIFLSSGPQEAQDRDYTAESHLQPICSDSIRLCVQNPAFDRKDSPPPHDPWSTHLSSFSDRCQSSFATHWELPPVEDYRSQSDNDSTSDPHDRIEIPPVPESNSDHRGGGERKGLSSLYICGQLDGDVLSVRTESDNSVSPPLSLACRFLPHDRWFTTHIDPDWKVQQVKSWLLAKCLPDAAPPSPPLRQSARKFQRSPSPVTFVPDPRHRPISPIIFAMPKRKVAADNASEFEEPPITDLSEPEPQPSPEEILPPIQSSKKRAILPTASTSAKRDLYSQYTLIRFSTGQLLEDDLPLSFYNMEHDELLELHRVGTIVTLPRAHPTRYLGAYWEGHVRVLRMKPPEDEDDSYPLYKVRQLETRALEWCERWLVVREGSIYLCRDEHRQTCLIHTLSLADLVQLTNTGVPPSAIPPSETRFLLARFSPLSSSLVSTRASSPINSFDSDSSSNLSSPIFAHDSAHDSSDSSRPRRKLHRRVPKRADPEYLILDLKDDAAYGSLLRVLHRHALPWSSFVNKHPAGTAELREHSPHSALPDNEDADDDVPPLRHPLPLARLRIPPHNLSFGARPFPEWRINVLQRARRAGLGRIGTASKWALLLSGETAKDSAWMLDSISPVRSRRRRRPCPVKQPTSTDGYDTDVSGDASLSLSDNGEDDSDSESAGARSETEWVGWMGDLRRQAQVATEERARAAAREEARRLAEETRDAELGLPSLPPGSATEVTIARVGTGVDDRQRRVALEPSAIVMSLPDVNPPSHPLSQAHLHLLGVLPRESLSSVSEHATPVLSLPAHKDPLLDSLSMHYADSVMTENFLPPYEAVESVAAWVDALAQPSMPAWGETVPGTSASRPLSSFEGGRSDVTAVVASRGRSRSITKVPRTRTTVGRSGSESGGKGLRKNNDQRKGGKEKEQQSELSDRRKGKEKDKEKPVKKKKKGLARMRSIL